MVNEERVAVWLKRILGHEGGYTNNPKDPGNWTGGKVNKGRLLGTKWGIAANTYGHLDIKSLTVEDAAKIYSKDFLEPLKAENMRHGIAFQLLDFSVNSGLSRAAKELQQVIGVTPDGYIGPITLKAMQKIDESDLVMLLLAERLEFLTKLKLWKNAGKGWARRIAGNLRYAAKDT